MLCENAYNNSAVYRQNGCSAVTVMDANFPRDNRYNGSAWGVADVPGTENCIRMVIIFLIQTILATQDLDIVIEENDS
jgi:hypothetical protein